MNLRRMLMGAGILLILFLGIYSWNRKTQALDDLAANVGLEASYYILRPFKTLLSGGGNFWDRYFNLVDVRDENIRLKAEVEKLKAHIIARDEAMAELSRLRTLVDMPIDLSWRPLGCRVLSGKLGPNGVLDSILVSRGYITGARPGMPLVTNLGLVGKVLRSSPHASTVLLVTDPKSRVAVFGQETRASGILKGRGLGNTLEVDFVQRDSPLKNGEVLVTSGLDGKYPKGVPVARVDGVAPSDYTQFMAVSANPLVDLRHLEEVILLEKTGAQNLYEEDDGPMPEFVGPPLPEKIEKLRQQKAEKKASKATHPQEAPIVNAPPPDGSGQRRPGERTETAAQNSVPSTEQDAPRNAVPPNVPRAASGAPKWRIITP